MQETSVPERMVDEELSEPESSGQTGCLTK